MAPSVRSMDISLPQPRTQGKATLEETLKSRRTNRSFSNRPLSPGQLGQLLWAAYGVTSRRGVMALRTTPSAGALYPLEFYAVVGEGAVSELPAGVYQYLAQKHALKPVSEGDRRESLGRAALRQTWLADAPVSIIISAEYSRTIGKYGDRADRYVYMESGSASQNIFLQAESINLKVGIIGAFRDELVIDVLGIPPEHEPLLIMPLGYPKSVPH